MVLTFEKTEVWQPWNEMAEMVLFLFLSKTDENLLKYVNLSRVTYCNI